MGCVINRNDIQVFLKHFAPSFFRVVWSSHIDPAKRASYADDLEKVVYDSLLSVFEEDSGEKVPEEFRPVGRHVFGLFFDNLFGGFRTLVRPFDDSSFERLADRIVQERKESAFSEMFAAQFDEWTSRIANLSSSLISCLDEITEEYLVWLKAHPDDLDKIDWRAFERLTGEILASRGFVVQLTGQVKNRSSDVLAIETNGLGIQTKYIVECKRHNASNKVGMNIVNAVLGAKVRAGVDHAMLVTTSTFTRDVMKEKAALADLRLHLRDGQQFKEWLSDYEFKDNGLWLPQNWDLN